MSARSCHRVVCLRAPHHPPREEVSSAANRSAAEPPSPSRFGTRYFSAAKTEQPGSQHLYRSEMRWLLGLELRFPGRVKVW